MPTIGKVVVGVETQSAAFTKGIQDVQNGLRKTGPAAEEGAAGVNRLRAALESLREGAGRGSTLDLLAKSLRGGGAVAGIGLIGSALSNVTKEASELSSQFAKGQVDAAGIAVKLGESLPVIGGFVTAGQNIREMFTHEKEQIDAINQASELGNSIMEARVRLARQVASEVEELHRVTEEGTRRSIEVGLSPDQRKQYQIKLEYDDKGSDLKRKVQTDLDGVNEAVAAEQKKAAGTLQELQVELQHASPGSATYKTLETQVSQLRQTLDGLTGSAKKQRAAIEAEGKAAAASLQQQAAIAQAAPLNEYLERLASHLAELDPDPVHKVAAEVAALGGNAKDAAVAIDLMQRNTAAEQAKRNAEALKDWGRELDETAGKIRALQSGADEKSAELAGKLTGLNDAQRSQLAALQQRQSAEDAQLATLEKQKKVTEELAQLKQEAATAGLTEAQKKVAELAAGGATATQLDQAKGLQASIDKIAAWKKEQEEANKLIEQSATPLEKYQSQIDRVQKLFQDGLITAKQQTDGIKKAQDELAKKDGDDGPAKGSAAVTRRFDFTLPAQPQVASAQERAAALMKDYLIEAKKTNDQLKPLYDYFNNPDNTTPDVIYGG